MSKAQPSIQKHGKGESTLKQYTAKNIRNVALVGHAGTGKTSLTEAAFYLSGASDRLGRIADGTTVCDFDPEEIKRQVEAWMLTIPQRMQRIIRYRVFEELSWNEVAIRMGRKATADSVRMEYANFMKSE